MPPPHHLPDPFNMVQQLMFTVLNNRLHCFASSIGSMNYLHTQLLFKYLNKLLKGPLLYVVLLLYFEVLPVMAAGPLNSSNW